MDKKEPYTSWENEVKSGEFVRKERTFRDWIKKDGNFKPEKDRYHLYVSYACPWACRTLMLRKLKGLEDVLSFDVVDIAFNSSTGWTLKKLSEGATGDRANSPGFEELRQIYYASDPNYHGSWTVPVLWDKKTKTIVNNESSEIIRMLNSEFNDWARNGELDLYPHKLRQQIDDINSVVYECINNGVYKCGFAKTQEAYERAFVSLFDALEKVEAILGKSRYLCGDVFTEADVRLFTTLVRFDAVYYVHFKCNGKRIIDLPNTWNYLKEIYQMPGVEETVNMHHIKHHYFESHRSINPYGIVPIGPTIDFKAAHNRAEKFPI